MTKAQKDYQDNYIRESCLREALQYHRKYQSSETAIAIGKKDKKEASIDDILVTARKFEAYVLNLKIKKD